MRTDVIRYADMFVEPFYRLMRQQLLAHELEKARELEAEVVRVVHVAPSANDALRHSLNRDSHRAGASDVFAAWQALLRQPDRFLSIDSTALFGFGSDELAARYAHA